MINILRIISQLKLINKLNLSKLTVQFYHKFILSQYKVKIKLFLIYLTKKENILIYDKKS